MIKARKNIEQEMGCFLIQDFRFNLQKIAENAYIPPGYLIHN